MPGNLERKCVMFGRKFYKLRTERKFSVGQVEAVEQSATNYNILCERCCRWKLLSGNLYI